MAKNTSTPFWPTGVVIIVFIILMLALFSDIHADTYEIVSTDSMWDTMIENGNEDAEDSASHCDAATLDFGKDAPVSADIGRILFKIDFTGTPCTGDQVDSVIMQVGLNQHGGRDVDRCSAEVFLLLLNSPLHTCESDTAGGCGNINMGDANICTTAWNTAFCEGEGTDREASPRAYVAEDEDAGFNQFFTFPITDLATTWIDYPDSNLGAIIICTVENGNLLTYQRFVWYGDDQTGAARSMQATVYYTVGTSRRRILLQEMGDVKDFCNPARALCERDSRYY